MNQKRDYFKSAPFAITIRNLKGVVLYINDASIKEYASEGGQFLIGKSLVDCHPEPAMAKLLSLLKNPVDNSYIYSDGPRSLFIYDFPWKDDGIPCGIVELLFPLEVFKSNVAK